MKKQLLVLMALATCISSTVLAQKKSSENPGGIYLKGGLNLSNISTKNNGTVDDAKTLTTFQAGFTADVPLAPVLSFQTGLLLNGKGAKSNIYFDDNNHSDNYYKVKTNPFYLELPANLVIKLPVTEGARFYVGAGPYAAMGLFGKVKGEARILGITTTFDENIKFNNDDPFTSGQEGAAPNKVRRFDYGLNGLAGIEAGRIMAGINYGLGLAKINSGGDNDANDKNKYRVFTINLGVRL